MPDMKVIPVVLPADVVKRLQAIAPKSPDLQYLLCQLVLEGLNRYEMDCLWCNIRERSGNVGQGEDGQT